MSLLWRYGILLAVTVAALAAAVRRPMLWTWGIAYLLELGAFYDAYACFRYYCGLAGEGLLPWLSFLREEAFSFGGMFAFGILFFVTLSVHIMKHGVTDYSLKFRKRVFSDPNSRKRRS